MSTAATQRESFGLTEVFTCSAAHAISVTADEIGAGPVGDDRVERLRKRTNRGVVRKIMQQHESALAKCHMKANSSDLELRRIHAETLRALDNCEEDDATFRAMLNLELKKIDDKEKERLRSLNRTRFPLRASTQSQPRLEAVKEELKTPIEEARHKLAELKMKRKWWAVVVAAYKGQ
jgi:hypothetical protein